LEKTLHFWFDLENAPDVLFFYPIVSRLKSIGHRVSITFRDYSEVPQLMSLYGLQGKAVGVHAGKHMIMKVAIGLHRSFLLLHWAMGKRVDLAVGFGSRPLAVACGILRIPNATVFDYEHVSVGALKKFSNWIFVPQEVSLFNLAQKGIPASKIIQYAGLKEEVYTCFYEHKQGFLESLGLDKNKVIVTIRPPATKAHYHDLVSETICRKVLEKIASDSAVVAIFLRRDGDSTFDEFLDYNNIVNLNKPVDGLSLIVNSDLVISGGGTMIREAVLLGVPSYSTFTGTQGMVDECLSREGRLVLVRTPDEISKIVFKKRDRNLITKQNDTPVLNFFLSEFVRLAKKQSLR
jgi:predicted glycosyltransferase